MKIDNRSVRHGRGAAQIRQGLALSGLLAVLCVTIHPQTVVALDPDKRLSHCVRKTYTPKDGLPQISVLAIEQTPDGYLWLGTQEGLVRYDGVHFFVFNGSNTPELGSEDILDLHVAADGSLWIASRGGALNYRGGRFTAIRKKEGLLDDNVHVIRTQPDGTLWIGTAKGLTRRDKAGRYTNYTSKDGLLDEVINDIFIDSKDRLWLVSPGGVQYIEGADIARKESIHTVTSNDAKVLIEDKEGTIWIGCWGRGLLSWKEGTLTEYGASFGLPTKLVIATITQDRAGNLWFGSIHNGLYRMEGDTFVNYTDKDGLPDVGILEVFEDIESNLWVGTWSGGVGMFRNGKVSTYTVQDGIAENEVQTTMVTGSLDVWMVHGQKGVSVLRGAAVTNYSQKDGFRDNLMRGLLETRDGQIWIGSYNHGIYRFEDGKFVKLFSDVEHLNSTGVRAMLQARNGDIWIGTYGKGAYRVRQSAKGQTLDHFDEKDGLKMTHIIMIAEDSEGGIWFGAMVGGLTHFKDGKFRIYGEDDGLRPDTVPAILPDRDGRTWLGTLEGGLVLLQGGKFTPITHKQGMPDDSVYTVIDDQLGNLWMSSNNGIFRVSKQELVAVAEGRAAKITPTTFDENDGMASRECNGGSMGAGIRAPDGKIWFASMGGAVVVDPANLPVNKVLPKVVLHQLIVDEEPRRFDAGARLKLEPGVEKLEFHFTSPSFVATEKITFKYRLTGYDTNWIDAGTRRVAYYTNLDPGRYTFELAAKNADGFWSKEQALIEMDLLPAFWQTTWFRLAVALALLLAAYAAYRLRTAAIRRQNIILEQKVKERTVALEEAHAQIVQLEKERTEKQLAGGFAHEIRNALSSAQMLMTKILGPKDADPPLSLNARNSERLIALFNVIRPGKAVIALPDATKIIKEINETEKSMQQYAQKVMRSIERSLDVTGMIMEYSRIGDAVSAGDEPVDVNAVIEDLVEERRVEFHEQGISIRAELKNRAVVAASKQQLYSVLENLLLNSKDALIDNGCPSDRPKLIEIGTTLNEGQLQIKIKDNGIGIDGDIRDKILDPFFSTKPSSNTGLGLGSVLKYLSLYKGELTFDTVPGEWTEFTVNLPRGAPERL